VQVLRLGSVGPDVKLAQSLLNKIGYPVGAVDGIYGTFSKITIFNIHQINKI